MNSLQKQLKKFLKKKKVSTIKEMCLFTSKADITVKQALGNLNYITSYNHNSRFYTLTSVARFNQYGIWKYKDATFTRHYTLSNLIIELVNNSESGYNCLELKEITGVTVRGLLCSLSKKGKLVRIRYGRVFFYFTARSKRLRKRQITKRFDRGVNLQYQEENMTLSDLKKTIVILLEIIRSKPKTQLQIKERLFKSHPEISAGMIGEVCRKYNIVSKKN